MLKANVRDVAADVDIIHDVSGRDWIVVSWFTPDYRHHAQRLSEQLRRSDAPHHLFACPKMAGTLRQITRHRPEILLRAMEHYSSRTLVSLDIDCHVYGSLEALAHGARADIRHYMKPRQSMRRGQRGRLSFGVSDRVLVFRPTAEAHKFVSAWLADCGRSDVPKRGGSEWARSKTMARCDGVMFESIPVAYAGLETDKAPPGAVILHVSENRRRKRWQWPWRRRLDVVLAIFAIFFVVPVLWLAGSLDD